MLNIYSKYAPNANVANTNYPHGSGKDESASGTNDGTPLEMDWYNDMLGYSEALLAEAGVGPSGSADTALNSDRMNAFRIAAMRVETAVAYADGDVSLVGVIALVTGEDVTDYEYIVDGDSLTRWSVGSVTGVFAGDFNSSTGVDSGLSGALVNINNQAATSAEINTGTDATKKVTPVSLLASEYGFAVSSKYSRSDISGSLVSGATVTNTSGYPKEITFGYVNSSGASSATVVVGGITLSNNTSGADVIRNTVTFTVMQGESYVITYSGLDSIVLTELSV